MILPLMPKATAVWLVDNTALTFVQIADFTGLHPLEVQGVADGEVATGLQGADPVTAAQLTLEEIKRCEDDPTARLTIADSDVPRPRARTKGQRYTPVSKRHDRPAAILWLLRFHPELTDTQVSKLVGTTKPTINSVRDRTHWNMQQLKPNDPVSLGMCTQQDLDQALQKARDKEQRRLDRERRDAARKAREKSAVGAAGEAAPEEAPEKAVPEVPEPALASGPTLVKTDMRPESELAPTNKEAPSAQSVFGDDPTPEEGEPESESEPGV
jgi:hypothetical protein